MAKNLRAKIPAGDRLVINDRNTDATKAFVEEVGISAGNSNVDGKGSNIEVVSSPRKVAEMSVSAFLRILQHVQIE